MDNLQLYIESLIFASSKSLTAKDIKVTLNAYLDKSIKEKEITTALDELTTKYNDEKYPFEILEIAGGYQFMTKGTYYPVVSQFLKIESKKKLSKAHLETLAVVSYKQPVTKSSIESIRGVNCDYSIQKLLDKELVEISGRAEGPGRPLLYATSQKFMDHFGLKDLNDLPKIKEFEMPENEIGPKDSGQLPDPNLADMQLKEGGVEADETPAVEGEITNEIAANDAAPEATEEVQVSVEEPNQEIQSSTSEAPSGSSEETGEAPSEPKEETVVPISNEEE